MKISILSIINIDFLLKISIIYIKNRKGEHKMIGQRIKEIRKEEGKTQTEFAESIGIKQGHLTNLERGVSEITERTLQDICRVYNVSYEWLTTGEGETYISMSQEDQLKARISEIMQGQDDFAKALMFKVAHLETEQIRAILEFAQSLLEKEKRED